MSNATRKIWCYLSGLAAVALGVLAPSGAEAQSLRGTLLHEFTNAPIIGAYVVLLSSDSSEVTRALTDPLGQFVIHAPRPGTYRVRTERIGYRSIVSSSFNLTEGEVGRLQLTVEPVVLTLDMLTIEGADECLVIGDQAIQVLTVWEEARKALSAVAWTGPGDRLIHELERFERWYTPNFRMVHEIRDTTPTHNVMPFLSRTVEELEQTGYVIVEQDSVIYEAPDAHVFFSTPFLQHHCFRLDQSRRRGRSMLGLRFEPIPGRTTPDVKGVFWLDAETGALDRLELAYVNVGVWQRERGAAGELDFEQLPDGRWFVSSWWIRMPVVRRGAGMQGPVWQFQEAVVGFKQEGGDVTRVFAPDGRTLFARERATVAGVVFDSTTGEGLAGAFVRLQNTNQVTISQADGSYWLTDLPNGDYTVTFTHPRAELLGLGDTPDREDVKLDRGSIAHVDLELPSARTIIGQVCGQASTDDDGLLVGTVRNVVGDSTVEGARVRVIWLEATALGDDPTWREVITDGAGIYRMCVPKGLPLSVEVTATGLTMVAAPTRFGAGDIHELHIEMGN